MSIGDVAASPPRTGDWEGKAMPALLAYLVSITVFLGGAYAGLNWAVSPAAQEAPIRAAGTPIPQPHPKRKPEIVAAVAAPSVSNAIVEAAEDTKTEIAAPPILAETKPNVIEPAPESSDSSKPAAEPKKAVETRKPAERIAAPVKHAPRQTEAGTSKSNAAMDKPKESTSKPEKIRQVEHHRKPVMMILRTIEFADGRREQHLLPMSQARMAAY
jgi:hypothetical protein